MPKIILVIQHLSTSPFVQQAGLSIRSLANHDHYSVEIRIAIFFLASLQRLWPCSRRKSYFNHIWATCGRELQRKIDLSSYAFFQQGNFLFSSNLQGFAQRITRPIACREKQIYHVTHYFKNFLFPSSLQGSTQRIKKRTRYFRHHFQFTLQDIQQSKCLAQDISLFHVMNLFCPFVLFWSCSAFMN